MTQPATAHPQSAREEWRRYWPTALAAMIGMSFYTVITYSLSTFIGPLEKEFGWSRTALSSGLTIFAAISMAGGPLMGVVIDRVGTRWITIVGMALSGCMLAAFSLLNGSMRMWIGLYVVYGLVALAIKTTVWSAGIASVFTHSRSLALAVVLSGSAIGQTFAPIVANRLITAFGWREAYIWLGFGWAGVALLLLVPFYFDAHARKARDNAATGATAAAVVLPGLTVPQAIRDSRVIRIAVANLLMSAVGSGVSVHLVRIVSENGVSMDLAVKIAATAGLAGLVGKLGVGWLLDRIQGSVIPFMGFAIGATGHFLLIGLFGGWVPLLLGAICLGFSSGAGLQISAYLISRYAGLKNYGVIFGTISSMMMGGMALGPMIAGSVHDLTGSYTMLEIIAAPVMLTCAILFIGLGPYPVFKDEGVDAPTG